MLNFLKGALFVLILGVILTFSIKNHQAVQLSYYFNTMNIQLPAYALVFLSLFAGMVLGLFVGWYRSLRLKREIKKSKQKPEPNTILEDEISEDNTGQNIQQNHG